MARGKKYSDRDKEKAYLMYATSGSYAEVSKSLGIPESTIATWITKKKNSEPDEFEELRNEKRKDFIEQATEVIDLAFGRLVATLTDNDTDIPVNHLTTVIGTMYDKRALARDETGERVTVELKLPEGVGDYGG